MITIDEAKNFITELVTKPDAAAALKFADSIAEVYTATDALSVKLAEKEAELTEARRIAQELFLRQTSTEKQTSTDSNADLTMEKLTAAFLSERKGKKNA